MATQTTSNGQFTNQHVGQHVGQHAGQFGGQTGVQGTAPVTGFAGFVPGFVPGMTGFVPGVQTPWFSGVGAGYGVPAFNGFGGFNGGFNGTTGFNGWNPGYVPTIGQTLPGAWGNTVNPFGTVNPFNTVNPFTAVNPLANVNSFNGFNPVNTVNPYAAFNGTTGFNGFNGFNTVNPFGWLNGVTPWANTPWNSQFQSPVNGWFNGQSNPFTAPGINAFGGQYGSPITNTFPFTSPINNPFTSSFYNPFTGSINNTFTSPIANPFTGSINNPFTTGLPIGWNTVNPWFAQTPWGVQNQAWGAQNGVNCPISGDCSCPPGVCVGPTGGTFNSIPTTPTGLVNPIAQSLSNNFGYTQPYGYNLPFGVNASFNGFGGQFPTNTQNWTPWFAQNWFQNYTNAFAPTTTGFNPGFTGGLNSGVNTWGFNPMVGTPSFQTPSFVNGISYPTTSAFNTIPGSNTGYPTAISPTLSNTFNPFPVTARWNGTLNPITQSLIAQNLGYGVNGVNTVNGFNGFNGTSPINGVIPGYNPAFAPVLNGLAGGIGSVYGYPFATGYNGSPINGYPVNGYPINGYPINGYPTGGSNNLTNGYTTALVNGVPTVVPTTVNGQSTGSSNVGQNTTVSPVLVGSCRAAA